MSEEAGELNAAGHGAGEVDAQGEQFGADDVFEAGRGDGEEGKTRGVTANCRTPRIRRGLSEMLRAFLRFQQCESGYKPR